MDKKRNVTEIVGLEGVIRCSFKDVKKEFLFEKGEGIEWKKPRKQLKIDDLWRVYK